MIIPPHELSTAALDNIISEYLLREDIQDNSTTDSRTYHDTLRQHCLNGSMLILFSEDDESITLMTPADYQQHSN